MAKRKKSKKAAKSKAVDEVQAAVANELASAETETPDADEAALAPEKLDVSSADSESVAAASETAAEGDSSSATETAQSETAAADGMAEDAMDTPAVAIESKRKRGKNRKNGAKAKPVGDDPAPEAAESTDSVPAEQEPTAEDTDAAAASTEAAGDSTGEDDATGWLADDAAEPAASADPDAETYDSTWANEAATAATGVESSDSAPAEASALSGEGAEVLDVSALDGEGSAADGEASANGEQTPDKLSDERLESVIESLLFASDKALNLSELKRLIGEKDGKKVSAAVERLIERRKGTGIEVIAMSTGWHLRTSSENADWVGKLLVGKPVRLSRAMLETLAIVAYRQPVTRPEVDDIRGVDCGAVLKTLLDRGLIRIIGKKEEVGRPMLYGTTPEFLRVFNLRDLTELPTLREFYDLSAEDQSKVEAEHGPEPTPSATTAKPDVALTSVSRGALAPEPEDTDPLLDELDEASQLAKKALGDLDQPAAEGDAAAATSDKAEKADNEPSAPAAE